MTNRKAFTLIEALVVVAIIGIMVMVALPAFNQFFQMYKFRTQMNQIATDIRSARQAAITNGRPVKITFLDIADYPDMRGMTGGYAIYMLNSADLDDMAVMANWLEIAPARLPCGGMVEKPRFLPQPILIEPGDSHLGNVEGDDADGALDLVFRADGSIFEGPYPQDDAGGAILEFKDDVGVPGDLSPAFTMKTVGKTTVDRYVIFLSLFGKVSVHAYHS